MKQYLTWNKNVEIEIYTYLMSFLKIGNQEHKLFINNSATEIIKNIDGTKSYEELIEVLSNKYKEESNNVKEIVNDCLNRLADAYGLTVEHAAKKQKSKVSIIGEAKLYPKVASIEITSKCNLRCLHCYGEYGVVKTDEMKLENVCKLLDDLDSMEVEIIELTGGDITMHKNLYEIVAHALSLNFSKIELLTNGVLLSDEVIELVIANRERMCVQIDLHSRKDDYMFWFTKRKVSCKELEDKIRYLSNHNVLMRVATVFTNRNIDEFDEIGNFVKEVNQRWGVSPVESLGRADTEKTSDLYLQGENADKFNIYVDKFVKENPGVISVITEESQQNRYNCGVLTEHVVLDSCGNIKLCTMDNLNYCNTKLGNVFEKSIKDIYDENKLFVETLIMQKTPKADSSECQSCEHKYSCANCMLRALINMKKKEYQCEWFKKNLNQILVDKFYPEINGNNDIKEVKNA